MDTDLMNNIVKQAIKEVEEEEKTLGQYPNNIVPIAVYIRTALMIYEKEVRR